MTLRKQWYASNNLRTHGKHEKQFVKHINEQNICIVSVWFIITLNQEKFYLNSGNLFLKILVIIPKCQPIYMFCDSFTLFLTHLLLQQRTR